MNFRYRDDGAINIAVDETTTSSDCRGDCRGVCARPRYADAA